MQQQRLLDRSFRAQRQMGRPERNGQGQGQQQGQQQQGQRQPGQQQPGDQSGQQPGDDQADAGDTGEMGDAAGQQDGLRRSLGEMMRRLGDGMGDIPEPFGRAERAMRDATGALQKGRPGQAIAPQTEALDQLQQAALRFRTATAAATRQRLRRSQRRPGRRPYRPQSGRLRLYTERATRSAGPCQMVEYRRLQSDVKIPDENILQKSRQILDELRRRAGDRSRPEIELDYIDRLLKRF